MSRTLHQQLVELRDRAAAWAAGYRVAGFESLVGICFNLELSEAGYKELNSLIARWPGHSGSKDYPVPHPRNNPTTAYKMSSPVQKWHPVHEYARNRWALLEWLIAQTASEADQ